MAPDKSRHPLALEVLSLTQVKTLHDMGLSADLHSAMQLVNRLRLWGVKGRSRVTAFDLTKENFLVRRDQVAVQLCRCEGAVNDQGSTLKPYTDRMWGYTLYRQKPEDSALGVMTVFLNCGLF